MARLSRLQISKADIVDTFANRQRILRARDIAIVLNQNRDSWRLAQSTSLREFIAFLVSKTELLPVRFPFPQRELIGYT